MEPETNFLTPDAYSIQAPGAGFYLLGLMQGHWDTAVDVRKTDADAQVVVDADLEDQLKNQEAVNMGIAMVTPMEKILPLLHECAARQAD